MKPRDPAWLPCDYDVEDIYAIQAVNAGTADAAQQRKALEWIINKASATYDETFRSDKDGGERDTNFAQGRAYVGRNVVKLINIPPNIIATMRDKK